MDKQLLVYLCIGLGVLSFVLLILLLTKKSNKKQGYKIRQGYKKLGNNQPNQQDCINCIINADGESADCSQECGNTSQTQNWCSQAFCQGGAPCSGPNQSTIPQCSGFCSQPLPTC